MRGRVLALCLLSACAAEDLPARSTMQVSSSFAAHADHQEGCGQLSWPVDAVLSSPFGARDGRPHLGIDLAVPVGTDVHAACAGTVLYADEKLRGYGRMIILEHPGGLSTVYAHNQAFLVRAGERVVRGQVIARSGATGHVTAPHVHFETRRGGHAFDPLTILPAREPHLASLAKWSGR